MNIRRKNWILGSGGPSYDPVASTFFAAAGITDSAQKTAVNTLILTIRDTYGIALNSFLGIWPIVGGSAGAHVVNLISPGTNNLVLHGGIIHSATGMKFNSTTGYAQMGVKPSDTGYTDICFGTYLGTDSVEAGVAMGSYDGANHFSSIYPTEANTFSIYASELTGATNPNNHSLGLFVCNRSGVNVLQGDIKGVQVINDVVAAALAASTKEFFLSCYNSSDTPSAFTDFEHRFSFIAHKLTGTQRANLYTAVQAYQTALSRNV